MRKTFSIALIWAAAFTLHVSATLSEEQSRYSITKSQNVQDALVRQMIGQMILVGFVGNNLNAKGYKLVVEQARLGRITGVIYLKRNIKSLTYVKQLNEGLQSSAATPLLIAIDQEGGRIQRLINIPGFIETPSAALVGKTFNEQAAQEIYEHLSFDLARLGFNLNLAPVVDLNRNPANPIIGKLGRSFSADPVEVEKFARSFVKGHRSNGVLTVLKHFPGHGSSTEDSHNGTVDVTEEWNEIELQPYKGLIGSGDADMIMSAHISNGELSKAPQIPASLSFEVLTELLRYKMGYQGVVISDDMQMKAVTEHANFKEAVLGAILAGNDILIFANDKYPDPYIPDKVAELLSKEARSNPLMLRRIEESFSRVIQLKSKLIPELIFDKGPKENN